MPKPILLILGPILHPPFVGSINLTIQTAKQNTYQLILSTWLPDGEAVNPVEIYIYIYIKIQDR